MDEEDKQQVLTLLRHAKKLLAEKPFTHYTLFTALENEIINLVDSISDIFPLFSLADWSDELIFEFIVSITDEVDSITDHFKIMDWDMERFWQVAIKSNTCSDSDLVKIALSFDNNFSDLVTRLLISGWNHERIIRALENFYSIWKIIECLTSNSNDFKVIEILKSHYIEYNRIVYAADDKWQLPRIIKAFRSAGCHLSNLCQIMINDIDDLDVEDIISGFFLSGIDPLLAYHTVYTFVLDENIINALEQIDSDEFDTKDIVKQLNIDDEQITQYLKDGYFRE